MTLNDMLHLPSELLNMLTFLCKNAPLRYREWRGRRADLIEQVNVEFERRA